MFKDDGRRLKRVALGNEPADIVLTGGDVLNVYSGEILHQYQVLIAGERIAYVGPAIDVPIGDKTRVLDVRNCILLPGFIDGHSHMDLFMQLSEYVKYTLPKGTTTIVTECNSLANCMGLEGVKKFVSQFRNFPMHIFATAPMTPYLCSFRNENEPVFTTKDMEEIIRLPEVVGLGEIYWSKVINTGDSHSAPLVLEFAQSLGKTIEGHTSGAKGQRLVALVSMGFESCHESINANDALERLRAGIATMIREGSVRRDLEEIIKSLVEMDLDLRKAMFVSDGLWPHELVRLGHMDFIVNKAISLGLNPIKAVQMATLNVAEHFHLDRDIGGIAPGKYADLIISPSIHHIQPQIVISRGQIVGNQGKLTVNILEVKSVGELENNLRVMGVEPEYFEWHKEGTEVKVRALEVVTDIVNRETVLTLPIENGRIVTSGLRDVVKVCVIDRFECTGKKTIGFLKGFGFEEGAVGSSFSFDEGNLVVLGTNDEDMAAVVNQIIELNGGIVIVSKGRIISELPLPLSGIISDLDAMSVAQKMDLLINTLQEMGCHKHHNPLLTLFMITFGVIPSLRLSLKGHLLAKEGRFVEPFIN